VKSHQKGTENEVPLEGSVPSKKEKGGFNRFEKVRQQRGVTDLGKKRHIRLFSELHRKRGGE